MRKKYLTKNHLRSASSFIIIGDKYFLLFQTVSDMTNTKLKNRNLNVRGLPLKTPVQKIIIVAQVVSSQSMINAFGYFPTVSDMTNTKLRKYQNKRKANCIKNVCTKNHHPRSSSSLTIRDTSFRLFPTVSDMPNTISKKQKIYIFQIV